jgi:hypothetical protein
MADEKKITFDRVDGMERVFVDGKQVWIGTKPKERALVMEGIKAGTFKYRL